MAGSDISESRPIGSGIDAEHLAGNLTDLHALDMPIAEEDIGGRLTHVAEANETVEAVAGRVIGMNTAAIPSAHGLAFAVAINVDPDRLSPAFVPESVPPLLLQSTVLLAPARLDSAKHERRMARVADFIRRLLAA